jgi:SMC interacting uncharacterized protein involved in chromosome segregation
VFSIRSTISAVIDEEQKHILGEFSLDNDQGALKRLVNELTQANGKLKTDLASEIGSVVQEFSLDKEDSALSRLVKRVEEAQETITKEFSLDEDGCGREVCCRGERGFNVFRSESTHRD